MLSTASLLCPSYLWSRCFLVKETPFFFLLFYVTPWPNQRKPSEFLKINECLTRKKKLKGRRNVSELEDFGEQPMYRWYLMFSKHQMLVCMPGLLLLFPGHFELTYQIEQILWYICWYFKSWWEQGLPFVSSFTLKKCFQKLCLEKESQSKPTMTLVFTHFEDCCQPLGFLLRMIPAGSILHREVSLDSWKCQPADGW